MKKKGRPLLPVREKRSIVLRMMLHQAESAALDQLVSETGAPDRVTAVRLKLFGKA